MKFVNLGSMVMLQLALPMTAVSVNVPWEQHPTALQLPVPLNLLKTFCVHVILVILERDVRLVQMVSMEILLNLATSARDAHAVVISTAVLMEAVTH